MPKGRKGLVQKERGQNGTAVHRNGPASAEEQTSLGCWKKEQRADVNRGKDSSKVSKPEWTELGLEPGILTPCPVFSFEGNSLIAQYSLGLKWEADLLVVICS